MSESVVDRHEFNFTESYYQLREDCARFPTQDLAIVELRGEDRKGWLQGQATNNLRSLDFGASSAFCLCEATGQVVAICEIWSLRDRFILTMDRSMLDAFLRRVEQMVIIEDVEAQELTDHALVSIQGPSATSHLSALVSMPALDAGEGTIFDTEVALLRTNRAGQGGWDVLLPHSAVQVLESLERDIPMVDQAVAEVARIEAGIPKPGQDLTSKTLPPELGTGFESRHVSYNKGCYMGQEVLMRMHSRGHTNRTWMGLIADQPFQIGDSIAHARRPDAGIISSAGFSPGYGYIGAATLRNEAANDGDWVTIDTSEGPVQAEVREMPIWRLE